jgi:hypothetical protein
MTEPAAVEQAFHNLKLVCAPPSENPHLGLKPKSGEAVILAAGSDAVRLRHWTGPEPWVML